MKYLFGFWFPPRMRHCANYSSSPPPHCQPTGVWGERGRDTNIKESGHVMGFWLEQILCCQFDQVVHSFNLSKLFSCAIGPEGELSLGKWSIFHTYLLLLAQKQEDNYKECLPFFWEIDILSADILSAIDGQSVSH